MNAEELMQELERVGWAKRSSSPFWPHRWYLYAKQGHAVTVYTEGEEIAQVVHNAPNIAAPGSKLDGYSAKLVADAVKGVFPW